MISQIKFDEANCNFCVWLTVKDCNGSSSSEESLWLHIQTLWFISPCLGQEMDIAIDKSFQQESSSVLHHDEHCTLPKDAWPRSHVLLFIYLLRPLLSFVHHVKHRREGKHACFPRKNPDKFCAASTFKSIIIYNIPVKKRTFINTN